MSQEAVDRLVDRHAALRTTFRETEGAVHQVVHDRPRPPARSYAGAMRWGEPDAEQVRAVDDFARSAKVTRYAVLLTLFEVALSRFAGRARRQPYCATWSPPVRPPDQNHRTARRSPMESTIRSFITETIEKMTGTPLPPGFDDDTPLGYEGVELDSLLLMELVVLIEREYGWTSTRTESELPACTLGQLIDEVLAARAEAA